MPVFQINSISFFFIALLLVSCAPQATDIIVFQAPFFNPVMSGMRTNIGRDMNVRIRLETGGSQVLLRKAADLKKACDILIVADGALFRAMAKDIVSWRIDFARDELVLGVGARAKNPDLAEKDWIKALTDDGVELGRADENLSPIGLRTLLCWKLAEQNGRAGLCGRLMERCVKKAEDVEHLAAFLKTGAIDYAFIYKTSCIDQSIRYIALPDPLNLTNAGYRYSDTAVRFKRAGNDALWMGAPVVYSLSVTTAAPQRAKALEWVRRFLAEGAGAMNEKGFVSIKPVFYGSRAEYEYFRYVCDFGGDAY